MKITCSYMYNENLHVHTCIMKTITYLIVINELKEFIITSFIKRSEMY